MSPGAREAEVTTMTITLIILAVTTALAALAYRGTYRHIPKRDRIHLIRMLIWAVVVINTSYPLIQSAHDLAILVGGPSG